MASFANIARIWRHATALGEVRIVATTGGGRHICELWLNGRRLDQRADARDLVGLIGAGWYDDLIGGPLSRIGVPARLSQLDEGGDYDPAACVNDFMARWGCDPATIAA